MMPRSRKPASPFRYFNSSPEVIRLVVMMYVRFPPSLRNVEDLLFERGIDRDRGGTIVLTGSVASLEGTAAFWVYGATKAAIRNFVRGWTIELKDRRIRSNALHAPIELAERRAA